MDTMTTVLVVQGAGAVWRIMKGANTLFQVTEWQRGNADRRLVGALETEAQARAFIRERYEALR